MLSTKIDEIKQLIEYGAPREYQRDALALLEIYENDIIALNLFHNFYSFLPEGLDDSITELKLVIRKEGVFLICAVSTINEYLYLVNQERAEFIGLFSEGIFDEEVLDFLGYSRKEEADKLFITSEKYPQYSSACENETLCPICAAAVGEYHTFGCPVEVCPWCGGQLTSCNCRFTILGKEHLSTENDLKLLKKQIHEKGRIAYDPVDQRPTYPGTG